MLHPTILEFFGLIFAIDCYCFRASSGTVVDGAKSILLHGQIVPFCKAKPPGFVGGGASPEPIPEIFTAVIILFETPNPFLF